MAKLNTQMAMQESMMQSQTNDAARMAEDSAWNNFINSLSGIGTEMFRNKAIAEGNPDSVAGRKAAK